MLKTYSPEIEYVLGKKNTSANVLLWFTDKRNQQTTNDYDYLMETMSELLTLKN